MPMTALTRAQRAQIGSDPTIAEIMADAKYSTPMLRDAAVNNYLSNDPRSPLRTVFGAEANLRPDGVPAGGLHYDPVTGQTQFTNTYGHPGSMKAVAVAALTAATLGAASPAATGAGWFGSAAGTAAGSGGAAAAAPAVNWAAAPSAAHLFAPAGLVGTAAPAATTAASTGAPMSFGLGSLANFFNSRGGEALVNAGTNLIGGRMQANAYNRSADIQAQAGRDALAFEQAQYEKAQAEYDAWLHGGPIARLDALLAQGRGPAAPPVNTTMPVPQGGAPVTLAQMRAVGGGQTPGAAAGGPETPSVWMQSPTGETRKVTPSSVQKYLQRGMSLVGA